MREHLNQQRTAGGEIDAAANALEFSFQKQRILISSGYHHEVSLSHPNLAELMQGTSAHSTLSVDMINSSQIDAVKADGRQACVTMAEVGPASGGLLGSHHMTVIFPLFGLVHDRKVFLTTGGTLLRVRIFFVTTESQAISHLRRYYASICIRASAQARPTTTLFC